MTMLPSSNSSSANKDGSQNSFTIRTMQDDLLTMQTTGHIPASSIKESSTTTPAIKTLSPSSVSPVYQKESISEIPSPFDAKQPLDAKPSLTIKQSQPTKIEAVETTPQENFTKNDDKSFVFKLILTLIVVLIVSIVALSIYYFLMTRAPKQAPPTTNTTPTEKTAEVPQEAAPVDITPPVEKYSATKPNYLALDLSTISADEIKTSIENTADEINLLGSQSPYEFIVVDANNNPVSFPIFATATKLNFLPTALKTFNENFSLFIFNDGGNSHLGLSVSTNNSVLLATELQKQEKTMPSDLAFLFLKAKPELNTGTFGSGSYGNYKTKYLNLNAQGTLSIDYSITTDKLILGTSKNTLRSILDKQLSASPQQSAVAEPVATTKDVTIPTTNPSNIQAPAPVTIK